MMKMSGYVKVLAYQNPFTFVDHENFIPYKDCPHICATKSLEIGVRERFNLKKVKSVREVYDLFYPEWNYPENRFSQYAKLSDILREWKQTENPHVLQSFKRNKLDLLITMRNLTEIYLTPNDVKPYAKKVEKSLFCEVWKKMQPHFEEYMDLAAQKIDSFETIKTVFAEAGIPFTNSNTVVLHGFYYISPVQHYLLSKWKECGINIVFLNLYNKKYPSVFSFLEENFSEKHGWAKKEDWYFIDDSEPQNGIIFSTKFDGTNCNGQFERIATTSYDYMIDFIRDLDEDICYVSPNSDEFKSRVKEFKPEYFLKERHFLSYPIGQYLFHLHSIWDDDRNEYILTERILFECFSSGWLVAHGRNARDYTEHLKKILPFFINCETVDQWLRQFDILIAAKKESSTIYENYNLKKDDYLEAVRINPLLRFSYYSISAKTIMLLKQFVLKLISNAKELLNIEEERVSIKVHFNRIHQLLQDSNIKSTLVHDIEKKLVEQLEDMLQKPIYDEGKYYIGDLADAIRMFLKTGLEDPDQQLVGSLDNQSNVSIEQNKTSLEDFMIYKMADIDGLILRGKFKGLHLCGMDDQHYPEKSFPSPWPLSFQLLSNLNNPSTNMYLFRKIHSIDFSRYLFYVSLCGEKEIQFSWVKNWGEHEELDSSIYIQLLGEEFDNHANENKYGYVQQPKVPEELDTTDIKESLSKLPQEEFAEMTLCKRRFYYSTIVDGFATYHSSFHEQFLIGNLVKIYAANGSTKEEIFHMLKGIFPFITDISLRNIIDHNMNENYVSGMRRFGLSERLTFNDIEYPESMMYFQFLTHKGAFQNDKWLAAFKPTSKRKQKIEQITQMIKQVGAIPEANPSVFCKLCPHSNYCEQALYPVDFSKKGFDEE